MRLKNRYLAIIVVTMVVLTAVLASWVVGSVQGTRVAYVAVKVDKSEFAMGENVTFSLVPLTQDLQFTITGDGGQAGVYVVRLGNDIDPDTFLDDANAIDDIGRNLYSAGGAVIIPIPQYNSTGDPLKMSWNGTMPQYDPAKQTMGWEKATAGNYVLYPVYSWQYGHVTKFMLDRGSIFHLGGPAVKFDISHDSSQFTIRTDITLPEDADPMSGLFTTVVPNLVGGYNATTEYHNETLDLAPGRTTTVTFSYPAPDLTYGPVTTFMTARLIVDGTTYVFGFNPTIIYDDGQPEVKYVQF
jgi:hypothetical protein